jgi:hypothetical protein
MEKEQSKRIVARCTAGLKKKVARAERITGQKESELIRAAVELFFESNTTAEQIIAAVVASRARRVAA